MQPSTLITLEQWQEWQTTYNAMPVVVKVKGTGRKLPSDFSSLWHSNEEQPNFVFESGKGGRYTFVGGHIRETIRGKVTETGKPLEHIRQWMNAYEAPSISAMPKFIGGCIGYLSYDVVRSIERIPNTALDDLQLPDYYFQLVERCWVIDHQTEEVYACAWHFGRVDHVEHTYAEMIQTANAMLAQWQSLCEEGSLERSQRFEQWSAADGMQLDWDTLPVRSPFEKHRFEAAVGKIQDYIRAGDVFQVNLSLRLQKMLHTSPERVYEWLRLLNPSPYMGMIRDKDFSIVSASPELLICREGDRLSTRPIAGTRRRGASKEEDIAMRDELLHNEKERAEHIMLVDLERNDLGRISEYGSVKVDELMSIEYYSHVMHIVSEVSGQLAAGKDTYDALAAVFPGGTITGAPKIRTMEIIEELEPVQRGPYTGSMGWIDYQGNMEFNIIIRTMVAHEGQAFVQAGAGIVIDSTPEREYKESLNKAKAIWKAIQYAEREQQEEETWS